MGDTRQVLVVELDESEMEELLKMIDLACRAQGIGVARNAAFLAHKLSSAKRIRRRNKGTSDGTI